MDSGAPPAAASLKVESATGSIKLGLLAQSQYEALGSPGLDGYTQNLFFRRLRILLGGTLFKNVDYFVETDFPNFFKAASATDPTMAPVKAGPGMYVQDAIITWKPLAEMKPMADMLKLDFGFMLTPMSHNAVQSAASLLAFDYFANTFLHANAFGGAAPVGRDLGLQARGLFMDGHIEYRVGLFQGLRDVGSATQVGGRNFFRVAARLQINLLDPETGFFYAGTYFGTKRVLSLGGSYDFQDNYKYFDVDAFLDMPLGPAGTISAQINYAQWDGGDFITALPKQHAIMAEAGFRFAELQLSPIVRFEQRNFSGAGATENRIGGGIAFWPYGHNSNLKAFYMNIKPDGAPHAQNQILIQWQVFFF